MLNLRDYLDWFIPAVIGALAAEVSRRVFRRRPRLVMWPTRKIPFNVKSAAPAEGFAADTASLFVQAIFVQNLGARPVSNVQIAHRARPAHFELQPVLNYRELTPPEGHIIQVATLGPRESLTLYTLSSEDPQLVHVRSDQGKAEEVSGRSLRVVTPFHAVLSCALQYVGVIALVAAFALLLQHITRALQ